jgi:integrase
MSDVSRMAWSEVGEGAIRVVQGKTGAKLTVPLHPELAEVLAAWRRSHQRILTTAFGKPFTPKGFGNWMADKIGQSGIPSRCITHGLRKAAARRLAVASCSANEIAAITGHATLAEIFATRRPLSKEHWQGRGSAGWRIVHPSTGSQTHLRSLGKIPKNPMKSTSICSTGAA